MNTAFLWLDVDASTINAPTVTREQTLPFVSLTWENFERLCFRLAHRGGDVEDARMYGERGQAQEGIDLYVRRENGEYATWQCKRYQEITATHLENAVTKFFEGDWVDRTKVFRLAVASSLNATQLAEEIETQRSRCEARGIVFEPLDRDGLSLLLKEHPDLVDDFFGRPWVDAFNGPQASTALSGRKLSREQKISARRFVLTLYSTHFKTVDGGIPAAAPVFRGAVERVPVFDRYVEPAIELVESIVEQGLASNDQQEDGVQESATASTFTGFRRREIRTKVALSAGLAANDRFLLIGGAGFGKSAALRVIIHSLLSESVRFPALTKSLGQRLPLLIPFGFLTRHFAENETATLESALNAWLKVLGAKNEVLNLLEEMIMDERLLLLVDGLDEWQNREAAVATLTALTAYVQTRRLPLIATSRPLGLERISDFGPDWKRADLLPLTASEQREFATYWFRHFHKTEAALDTDALELAIARDASEFADELSEDQVLSELGGIPLLLSVMIYLRLTGRVLPHSRMAAIEELIKALLEDHPRRRAQATMQREDRSPSRSPRIRRGMEYLAFCIHQESNSVILSTERAAELLLDFFRRDFELPINEAEEWATRVLELGQHEFGVLVAPQEQHVGLLHRIFQEYLAAKYLARLPLTRVKTYCSEDGRKAPWHEVTLVLMQLLERQDDVDGLIDELRKPVTDCLDEPRQQFLLTRIAVSQINCSRSKASELISQVFSWIECGRWMPLRMALIREIVVGLESEQVGAMVANRLSRWFPGRARWLHNVPTSAAKHPTSETISDLRIALHNCESSYESRNIAEALASFADTIPELAAEFLTILREAAEPKLLVSALYALAVGWPNHPEMDRILDAASISNCRELRIVAAITRVKRNVRSIELRDTLRDFCSEGMGAWPWQDDVVTSLIAGWPQDPELKLSALKRIRSIGFPGTWAEKPAIEYLLGGCPGDDDVALAVAEQMTAEDQRSPLFFITDVYESLLAGFTGHPLLIPAAESWLERNASKEHSPLEISIIAKLGGTSKCRRALFDWLQQGKSMPAWIISTLLELSQPNDPEVQSVLKVYMQDDKRREEAVRWLPHVILDPAELGTILRNILRNAHVFQSCDALAILVEKEGKEAPDVWECVEARISNDKGGHFWRLGHRVILKIWPDHPFIRELVKSTTYYEDISLQALYDAYGQDSEIRPLLDDTLRVLHEDLRSELVRAIEPLARRGTAGAISILAGFKDEPNAEVRTMAARSYARAYRRSGRSIQPLEVVLSHEFTRYGGISREGQKQAAIAALLDLDRSDLVASLLNDDAASNLSSLSSHRDNWSFIAAVVEHWESLAIELPDIWTRLKNDPVIATELAKAGKSRHALPLTAIFEEAIHNSERLDLEQVRALIAFHGRSTHLRDLFLTRLQHFLPGQHQSMMSIERPAYRAMASYITEHFQGDEAVGLIMAKVATSTMIRDVGLISLCRGWPNSAPIVEATAKLATFVDANEPFAAWLFSTKADAALMTKYLVSYPSKIQAGRGYFNERGDGLNAILSRLKADLECCELIFSELKNVTDLDTRIALAKFVAPSLRNNSDFHTWVSDQIHLSRENSSVTCQLAFDLFANTVRPVEFALFDSLLTRY